MNEELKALLLEPRIASVVTYFEDGLPHVTSVWFLYENESLYLAIGANSTKGRNLIRDPRIAVSVDVREVYREAGISVCGTAELLEGAEAHATARRLCEKYLTTEALEDPVVGPAFVDMSDLVVRVKAHRWISWDMAELDRLVLDSRMKNHDYLKPIMP